MAITLRKLRLVNWHYISDSGIIPIGSRTFITGGNGSGKSTVIDALQALFFVSKSGFNLANDITTRRRGSGVRTIVGYIRGLITISSEDESDDHRDEYVRKGPCISHIAAELWDDTQRRVYTVGVCFSLPGDRIDPAAVENKWWLAKDVPIEAFEFVRQDPNGGRYVQHFDELKKDLPDVYAKNIREYLTMERAKLEFSLLFGISSTTRVGNDKDLDLWARTMMKCIAFKPADMKNADQFVRSVVLEDNKIDTQEFKNLLGALEETNSTLSEMEHQQQRLQSLMDLASQCSALAAKEHLYQNIVRIIDLHHLEALIADKDAAFAAANREKQAENNECERIEQELRDLRASRIALERSDELAGLEPIRASIRSQEGRVSDCRERQDRFSRNAKTASDLAVKVNAIFERPAIDLSFFDLYHSGLEVEQGRERLERTISAIKAIRNEVDERSFEEKRIFEEAASEIGKLNKEIDSLRSGFVPPHKSAEAVRAAIASAFREHNIADTPKFLYELLDYKDRTWAQAAEAYLGPYLYAIIVMPSYFRQAADAYKVLCRENRDIHSVTLVDTTAFATEDIEVIPGSLADNFTTSNPFVRQYINFCYNKVMLVEDAAVPPSRDGTYISKDGMRYSKRSLSKMRPVSHPIIGAESRRERLAYCEGELQIQKERSRHAADVHSACREVLTIYNLNPNLSFFFTNGIDDYVTSCELSRLENDLAKQKERLDKLSKSPSYVRLEQIDRAILEKDLRLKTVKEQLEKVFGQLGELAADIKKYQDALNEAEEVVNMLCSSQPEALASAENELKKVRETYKTRSLPRIRDDLSTDLENISEQKRSLNGDIKLQQREYNQALGTNFCTEGMGSMEEFRNLYRRITTTDLPNINRKAEEYNRQALEMFQRDIISKLYTSIQVVQTKINDLNRTLRSMAYNDRIFQFSKVKPAHSMERYFKVISRNGPDGDNLDLFSSGLMSQDEVDDDIKATRELFEKLKIGADKEKGVNWLDYRSYCEFGIEVADAAEPSKRKKLDDVVSMFSGAEVQVPFYIILTASLVNRYTNGIRLTQESISRSNALRLMIVDECFNRMDQENTRKIIDFICTQMGLQLLAAAPSDRYENIGPAMDSIVFVKSAGQQRACFHFTIDEFQQRVDSGEIYVD